LKLGPSHPLFRLALLEAGDGDNVATLSPLRAPRRVCRYLSGDDTVDDVVASAGGVVAVPPTGALDADGSDVLKRTLAGPVPSLVVVQGPEGVGRRTVVARAARAIGQEAVAIDLQRLPSGPAVAATLAALRRECLLRGAVPIVAGVEDIIDDAPESSGRLAALRRFIDELDVHVALVT